MEKKTTGKAETLLFILGVSFAVFILLFIIIATFVTIVKNYKKGEGGTLFSLLRTAPEQTPTATNPPPYEEWPVEAITQHSEGKAANTGAHGELERMHEQRDLH